SMARIKAWDIRLNSSRLHGLTKDADGCALMYHTESRSSNRSTNSIFRKRGSTAERTPPGVTRNGPLCPASDIHRFMNTFLSTFSQTSSISLHGYEKPSRS